MNNALHCNHRDDRVRIDTWKKSFKNVPSCSSISIRLLMVLVIINSSISVAAFAVVRHQPLLSKSVTRCSIIPASKQQQLLTTTALFGIFQEPQTENDGASTSDQPATLNVSSASGGGRSQSRTNTQLTQLQAISAPLQGVLDEYTDGWAMSYADLVPDTPDTIAGRAFLATNLFYAAAGLVLIFQVGDAVLGFLTDVAALCSYNYHWHQLHHAAAEDDLAREQIQSLVKLSLLLDYTVAGVTILTALAYLLSSSLESFQHDTGLLTADLSFALQIGLLGVFFLAMSWKYEKGRPYMVYHSMWHLLSAYSGYLIGSAHNHVAATATVSPLLEAMAKAAGLEA